MNKTKVYCVVSAVAMSAVGSPMMNVLATNTTPVKEVSTNQTIEITTDEFIQNYLSTKTIVKDTKNVEQIVYTLIINVDENNYKSILSANGIFQLLKEDQQKEIINAYENSYNTNFSKEYEAFLETTKPGKDQKQVTAYDYLVALASQKNTEILAQITKDKETLKEEYDQLSTYKAENYTTSTYASLSNALTSAKSVLDDANENLTVQMVVDAQTALTSAKEALVDISELKESVNEGYEFLSTDKDMLEESSYTNFKKVLDDVSVVLNNENATSTDVTNALQYLNDYFDDNSHFVYKTVTLDLNPVETNVEKTDALATGNSETSIAKAALPTVEENKTTQEDTSNVVAQVSETTANVKETTDASVTQFISTYLTSSNGNVFTSANTLNASKILSGMQSWMSLSSAQKNLVNSELIAKGGKKYMVLVQEAQKIQLSSKTVNTATSTNSSVYAMLSVISLGFVGFITKRLKRD